MHLPGILVAACGAIGVCARNIPQGGYGLNAPPVIPNTAPQRYPLCPEEYETYCCHAVAPYSKFCINGECLAEPNWMCVLGPGKVESIRYCAEEVGGDKVPFCKRPGYENFASVLQWTGSAFVPELQPNEYHEYLQPGMKLPWVPPYAMIRWEDDEEELETADEIAESNIRTKPHDSVGWLGELRRREPDFENVPME